MAFLASGPLVSSRILSVNLAIISNFGVSGFSTKRMRFNSDGVGCGGEPGAAARSGRRRIAPPQSAAVPAGTAAQKTLEPDLKSGLDGLTEVVRLSGLDAVIDKGCKGVVDLRVEADINQRGIAAGIGCIDNK